MKSILKLQIMVQNKYLHYSVAFFLLIGSFIWSQFIEVNAELDLRRLSEGDRQLFTTLAEDIENYLLNTQFSADANDLEVVIDIRLVLESVSRGGSQTSINAQAIFSNKLDQYFYAKGIQFPYSQGRKMYYTTAFDPLASFLDYYAFMFIATELDTWEYMGGTSFFNRAIEISDLGKDSDWSTGWDDRWKKSRKVKSNQYLRSMRFNYFKALDALGAEDVDITIVNTAMNTFYEEMLILDKKLGSNKETLHFLRAYHESIAELMAMFNLRDALELLLIYDHDNKKVYESYLKN
jgi:hypothetical protein